MRSSSRKSALYLPLALAGVLACEDHAATAPAATPGARPVAAAIVQRFHEERPVRWTVWIPCAGAAQEPIDLRATLTTDWRTTLTESGMRLVTGSSRMQGEGVGLFSGTPYRINYQIPSVWHAAAATTRTTAYNFHLIGQGPGLDYVVHSLVHETIDASGNVTATVEGPGAVDCPA